MSMGLRDSKSIVTSILLSPYQKHAQMLLSPRYRGVHELRPSFSPIQPHTVVTEQPSGPLRPLRRMYRDSIRIIYTNTVLLSRKFRSHAICSRKLLITHEKPAHRTMLIRKLRVQPPISVAYYRAYVPIDKVALFPALHVLPDNNLVCNTGILVHAPHALTHCLVNCPLGSPHRCNYLIKGIEMLRRVVFHKFNTFLAPIIPIYRLVIAEAHGQTNYRGLLSLPMHRCQESIEFSGQDRRGLHGRKLCRVSHKHYLPRHGNEVVKFLLPHHRRFVHDNEVIHKLRTRV